MREYIGVPRYHRLIHISLLLFLAVVSAADEPDTTISRWRTALAGAFSVGSLTYASLEFNDNWGESTSPAWKWKKDDWAGDELKQNDEFSHFVAGQRVVQLGRSVALWAGFRWKQAELFGVIASGTISLWVEVKDAYNPAQGFGPVDLLFGLAGAGFELLRHRGLERWDLRVSFKSFESLPPSLIVAENADDYDNAIYWITYQPKVDLPIDIALGYSTDRDWEPFNVRRELYIGVGISGANLAGLFGEIPGKIGRLVGWYEITIGVQIYEGK